jgi:excinuclease ABC subunit C
VIQCRIIMIRQELDKLALPNEPGVYFFFGAPKRGDGTDREILYIGKATSLRDRVRSYFAPDIIKTRGAHIVDMVFKAETVTYESTRTVLEALILEANLIKKYKPYYNTKEKDDKSFNCVVITKEDYPRIILVRQKDLDTRTKTVTLPRLGLHNTAYDTVFGPFPSGPSIREALKIIRHIFPFRDRASAQKDKEAFYRQIGLAPDVSNAEAGKEYRKNVGRIKMILQGKMQPLIKGLKKEMLAAAKAEQFEEAELLKQKVFALEHIQDVSLIKRDLERTSGESVFRLEAYDIAHLSGKQMVGVMTVIENSTTNKNEYRKFIIRGFDKANDAGALREMLVRRLAHTEWPYPNAMVVDGNIIQINVAKDVLGELQLDIPIIAVTKDERHRPKSISGRQDFIEAHKFAILLANSEAHRFAITFHKQKRSKAQFGNTLKK